MSIKTAQRQVLRRRIYWGEEPASVLLDWLNRKNKTARERKKDPVEKLIRLQQHQDWTLEDLDPRQKIVELVNKTTRVWGLSLVPVAGITPEGWTADWRHKPTSKAHPMQLLAFIKTLHLASESLLDRVRLCARPPCGKYFFARFVHQAFCSVECQRLQVRSTPEWKKGRAEYMRRHRRGAKERERRGLQASKKGKRA